VGGRKFKMGAKNSKSKKGVPTSADESLDGGCKTATLPASFRQKQESAVVTQSETLPRNLNRSTSFTNSCRNWAKKKGLLKDKESPSKSGGDNDDNDTTDNNEPMENGINGQHRKKDLTPLQTKIATKKARAHFFEEMYNSSGLSVTSSVTPEKPKRLCDMNLPSPRIGNLSPGEQRSEGRVETLSKLIEEKERLNKSIDSDVISMNKHIAEEQAVEAANISPVCENNDKLDNDVIHEEIEKKSDIYENEIIKETTVEEIKMNDQTEEEETLDETLPSNSRLLDASPVTESKQFDTEEEIVKEVIEEAAEERAEAVVEPSSLESVASDDDTKVDDDDFEPVENVIIKEDEEEEGASTDEGIAASDDEEKVGAAGLRNVLKSDEVTEVNSAVEVSDSEVAGLG